MESELEQVLAYQRKQIEESTQELKDIQTRIKNGESTGNAITDFCIIHYSLDYKQHTEKLQNLESELKSHENGLVLVERVTEYVNNQGKPGVHYIISPVHIHDLTELQGGVIKGHDFLLLKEKQLMTNLTMPYFEIVVDRKFNHPKVFSYIYPGKLGWNEATGNIVIKSNEFLKEVGLYTGLGSNVPHNEFGPLSGEYFKSLKIFIGNQEVEKYFTERRYRESFLALRNLVGI